MGHQQAGTVRYSRPSDAGRFDVLHVVADRPFSDADSCVRHDPGMLNDDRVSFCGVWYASLQHWATAWNVKVTSVRGRCVRWTGPVVNHTPFPESLALVS